MILSRRALPLQRRIGGDELIVADRRDIQTEEGIPYAAVVLPRLPPEVLAHELRHPLLHAAAHPERVLDVVWTVGPHQTCQQMGLQHLIASDL